MLNNEYFVDKNGNQPLPLTKEEVYLLIDNDDEKTILPFCRIFDIPFIRKQWQKLRERYSDRSIFGKYLAKMKLKDYQCYNYADTNYFNQEEVIDKINQVGLINPISKEELHCKNCNQRYEGSLCYTCPYKNHIGFIELKTINDLTWHKKITNSNLERTEDDLK